MEGLAEFWAAAAAAAKVAKFCNCRALIPGEREEPERAISNLRSQGLRAWPRSPNNPRHHCTTVCQAYVTVTIFGLNGKYFVAVLKNETIVNILFLNTL